MQEFLGWRSAHRLRVPADRTGKSDHRPRTRPQHVAQLHATYRTGSVPLLPEARLRTVAGVQPIVGIHGETWWTWCKPTFLSPITECFAWWRASEHNLPRRIVDAARAGERSAAAIVK